MAVHMWEQVTLLGLSKAVEKCHKGRRMQSKLHPRINYACLEPHHFQPFVVITQPYEQLSHAALKWLRENEDICDVVQVCMNTLYETSRYLAHLHRQGAQVSEQEVPSKES